MEDAQLSKPVSEPSPPSTSRSSETELARALSELSETLRRGTGVATSYRLAAAERSMEVTSLVKQSDDLKRRLDAAKKLNRNLDAELKSAGERHSRMQSRLDKQKARVGKLKLEKRELEAALSALRADQETLERRRTVRAALTLADRWAAFKGWFGR